MNEEVLQIYKSDLWKDKRFLDPQQQLFIKESESIEENNTEVSVINFLRNANIDGIPEILKVDGLKIYMPIFKGIRVFELLVQLDDIYVRNEMSKAKDIKELIIKRCEERQKKIQAALIEWRKLQNNRLSYPQMKLNSIIKVLAMCKHIYFDESQLVEELNKLNNYWKTVVDVPFRDATTKNMVFRCEALSRIEIAPSKDKTASSRQIIENKLRSNDDKFWFDTPICDFDFSSCMHDTSLEDDVISLRYHERTFNGNLYIDSNKLVWTGKPDAKRAAISFYVRYYRFGGRKAAYRLINPINHIVRFEYDRDGFYFENLTTIMRYLWSDCDTEFPLLMRITDELAKSLGDKIAITDEFYKRFPDAHREPWAGMRELPGK